MIKIYFAFVVLIFFSSCTRSDKAVVAENPLFRLLDSSYTRVMFNNRITENFEQNVLNYPAQYNGGGVAIGDINNDGLDDLYFSANVGENKLYLNKGKMQFDDITAVAGVSGRAGAWTNGISMADVNGDGKLDIYVCYSGKLPGSKRINQLFINEGLDENNIPKFNDRAEEYGMADSSYSTQAHFFDYDGDGDLDMLLVNENIRVLSELDDIVIQQLLKRPDLMSGTKLFRNDNGHFKEVTIAAGLHSTPLSYGLCAAIADINDDGLSDIYVSNDYAVPDYIYINNGDGTFTNHIRTILEHTSLYSMGNDIADINNDGLLDIYTLDMLPEDNRRQKLLQSADNYEGFNVNVRNGLHYQYMRNMLHINNANGTFSEIGQLAGVSNTDWSWAPLLADYDNDGWKDLLVTNGYMRDFTNMDVVKYNENYFKSINGEVEPKHILEMLKHMPSSNAKNYIYKNNGNLTFTNKGFDWGVNVNSNSSGAAYADLDNDGDLDLVVNNINQAAFIYKNQNIANNNYLKIKLDGLQKNTAGLGTKVTLYSGNKQQHLEQMPIRSYLSSVSPIMHFGVGKDKVIDSLKIVWLSGKQQIIKDVKSNQLLKVKESAAIENYRKPKVIPALFNEVSAPIAYAQKKNAINDFKRQPLLVNPQSFSGPCMVKGDINGDGLEDVFVGGDRNEPGTLFVQQKSGKFIANTKPFEIDRKSEDADAVFLDANGDGYQDLYVVSGGYHYLAPGEMLLQDRLYLNDGKGNLTKAVGALPEMHGSNSCARVADFNGDGYPDIFVGGRVVPARYPETPRSYLLINDGKGHFKDEIKTIAPDLQDIGMVTDAAWIDLNGDNKPDLVLVGEWMPVTAFINVNGKLQNKTKDYFDKEYSGWWNKLQVTDINADGKPDLIIGNLGLNSQCKASDKEPAEMYYKDFDDNGAVDPILCFYIMGKTYPYLTRDELLDQISSMRSRFPDYKSYADATIKDIFTQDELKGVKYLEANYLKTAYFESGADGRFHEKPLPVQAQFSPVFTITTLDYDKDGNQDLLLCGNINQGRLRFGKYDANFGVLLKGNGKGQFSYVPQELSGFHLKGDVRSVIALDDKLLFGINQAELKAYQVKP
ncbi:MAG: VCBS repeat-containing protein [Sphingobacteriaceae bacterium]